MNETERDTIIARLDERSKHQDQAIKSLGDGIDRLHSKFDKYVPKAMFRPVQLLVYSFVGLVCSAVVASMVALVLK